MSDERPNRDEVPVGRGCLLVFGGALLGAVIGGLLGWGYTGLVDDPFGSGPTIGVPAGFFLGAVIVMLRVFGRGAD
jgi:hypothetical protein